MCNGLGKRLYRATRYAPGMSMYIGNKRCTHCERFVSMDGIYQKKTSSNCKCCDLPVRHTPYSGRKSITLPKSPVIPLDLYKGLTY